MGNTMLSTSEAMSSIYTQLSGTDKGVLPLVEACNLILDYILKNGFGSSSNNPLTPAQLEKIKEDVINKVKTQVPLGVLLKDCELNNSKIKFTLSDNSIKELDLTSLITNSVRDYVNTHKADLKGQKGDTGEQGLRGIQGKSAYDLWLEKGNVGTEVDFLNSLKGQKGDTGTQGLQGSNGTSLDYEWQGTKLGIKKSSENSYSYVDLKGSQGVQGLQGTKGDKGLGIKDISINGNNLSIKLDDESTKVITLPLLKGEQGVQGLRGERGHNSVIVSETEPNKAEYDVWIKPTENGIDIETLLQQGSQGSNDNNKLIKGTGSPKGVVQAEVNTLYLDKAKTNGAYLWLKTGQNNTEWKVIKGDTGTIEFTSKVVNGKIRIRRVDNWVILNFGGLQWDLFNLKPKAEVNGSSARKYTYNGNSALQLRLTNKDNLTQFVIPYGLRSVYPIYTPLFHDSGILLGSIFVAPNSDSNMIRFNIMGTEYADNGYVDLRCSNIIYYTDDVYPENLQNLIRGLTQ